MERLSDLNQKQLSKIKIGFQILYAPDHAINELGLIKDHKDIEYGFITSKTNSGYFCRYWMKGKEGIELRTTANSESTNLYNLFKYEKVDQELVDNLYAI
jgi:hypothetical protein